MEIKTLVMDNVLRENIALENKTIEHKFKKKEK